MAFVAPALGSIPVQASSATPALLRGYAVVSMDSGHQGSTPNLPAVFDVAFAADQQARLDYAYAAIGKVTERAKQLVQANYRSAPKHSYYMGCSTGGRESMIAAQRYPNEFDGVVVGNAAFRLSRATLGGTWNYQHLMAAAPKNAQGQKILARALTQKDLDAVVKGVLKRCDAKDGVADGIVNAWESCDFKPEMVQKGNWREEGGAAEGHFRRGEEQPGRGPVCGLSVRYGTGRAELAGVVAGY